MKRPALRRLATACAAAAVALAAPGFAASAHAQARRADSASASAARTSPRTGQALPEPGSNLTVYLMTMGVGEQVWENFGHNALWFHDAISGQDVVYNWGLFDFNQPHFIPHFLQGLMRYSMGGFDLESTLEEYRARDRSVWAQELDLSPAQKLAMLRYVEWNALPENRDYWYDYFTDNCSTRVRDIVDRFIGGQLRAKTERLMTGTTYRSEALRLTQGNFPLATGIDIGLGRPSDPEISAWQQMFVPMRLRDYVRDLRIRVDSTGATKPLVISEREIYASRTHNDAPKPPVYLPWFLAAGLLVAAGFLALGRAAARGARGARAWTATIFAVWSLAAGFLGLLLTLLWALTNHRFAHRNENLLLFNPLWLVLVVLVPMWLARGRAARASRWLATAVAALSGVALLLHVVLISRQDNLAIVALTLPPALALAWVAHRVPARSR